MNAVVKKRLLIVGPTSKKLILALFLALIQIAMR